VEGGELEFYWRSLPVCNVKIAGRIILAIERENFIEDLSKDLFLLLTI
jgi:hypothetical protein